MTEESGVTVPLTIVSLVGHKRDIEIEALDDGMAVTLKGRADVVGQYEYFKNPFHVRRRQVHVTMTVQDQVFKFTALSTNGPLQFEKPIPIQLMQVAGKLLMEYCRDVMEPSVSRRIAENATFEQLSDKEQRDMLNTKGT